MPIIESKGAASSQGFGEFAKTGVANYIEDVFSTYLYTGNGSTQTITNGIDESGKGALTWIKCRSNTATNNSLFDTTRGANKRLSSNSTAAQASLSDTLDAFTSSGFTLGADTATGGDVNANGYTYASWTFRKQPKFFDVVTYTGTGSATTIAHSLGSTPGCIIVKRTDTTGNWQVYHNGLTSAAYSIQLNLTNAQASATTVWNSTAPTSSVFSVGTDATVNASGGTYVAYLFAHNAGGFGLTGTDNVISCGSYTGNGSTTGPTITLGYEPQYLMIKNASSTGNWQIIDNMRGMPVGSADATLQANLSNAESSTDYVTPTATGFQIVSTSTEVNTNASTYIYIAIRRGPMKVPTDGTTVFALSTWTGSGGSKDLGSQTNNFGTGYFAMLKARVPNSFGTNQSWAQFDQLRGSTPYLDSDLTTSEYTDPGGISVVNNRLQLNNNSYFGAGGDGTGQTYIAQIFRRAPRFFDEVCYTGTGATNARTHNLTVVPELIICKSRSAVEDWYVLTSFGASTFSVGYLNTTLALTTGRSYTSTAELTTQPTATTFSLGSGGPNTSGATYVAYLFASCPGVSKVGSYTGTGATQTINCGFEGGARFVLIKRTDSTGDWYVWDTTRGMVAGTDPSLLLNSAAAEVNANSVYTTTGGFQIVSTAAGINASGGSYIYFSVA